MSKTSAYVDIKKPYQIPSSGFIDTARILTESEYNSTEETEDIFSDAQCNLIKPIKLEIDPDSDEDEFWDAQNELEEHDEGTLDPRFDEENSINFLTDKLVEDKKEVKVDRNPQQTKYNGSRHRDER